MAATQACWDEDALDDVAADESGAVVRVPRPSPHLLTHLSTLPDSILFVLHGSLPFIAQAGSLPRGYHH